MGNKKTLMCGLILAVMSSSSVYAAKKEMKGVGVYEFPAAPSIENLNVKENVKKVKKLDELCVGTFTTAFIQQSVVQVRARETFGTGKMRAAAGRRLTNVEKATKQAITDEAYAYAREALAKAGFKVKSDVECMAIKGWDKFKVSDKADGELKELGIFSGTMAIPTGATHASRHSVTGRPDYLSFAVSPFGDTGNQAAKSIMLAKKNNIGLADFAFVLDYNVN